MKINGTYSVEKNKAFFEITSVKVDKTTVEFKLSITVDANAEISNAPENAKDVIDFSQAEWEELGKAIGDSDFAKMIGTID